MKEIYTHIHILSQKIILKLLLKATKIYGRSIYIKLLFLLCSFVRSFGFKYSYIAIINKLFHLLVILNPYLYIMHKAGFIFFLFYLFI